MRVASLPLPLCILAAPALTLLAVACGGGSPGGSPTWERLANAEFPVALAFAPDGRLFYNELNTGNIRIVTPEGKLLAEPFAQLDIATLGYPPSEWGLIGLTLDPDFGSNHYVYVYFMESVRAVEPGDDIVTRLVARPVVKRFTEVDNRAVDPTVILADLPETDPRRQPWHVAGNIHFGPDGYLYVSIGEMRQDELAQDRGTVHGKILRVNKEDGAAPADNPFVGMADADQRIFAYGFRNPFDFAFQPETGRMYVTENGDLACDELNLVTAGGNYGWPGDDGFDGCLKVAHVPPVYSFALPGRLPEESTVAPTGIEFVSSDLYPSLNGSLLVCEWKTGFMRGLVLSGSNGDQVVEDDIVVRDCRLDIAISADGFIYYSNDEEIWRLPTKEPR